MKLLNLLGATCAVLGAAALSPGPALAQDAAVAVSSAPASPATHAPKKAPRPAKHAAMDLHTPPLNRVYSNEDLRNILAPDDTDPQDIAEVSVKGSRYMAPVPLGQFRAIPWAVVHPTQAWRIFAPVQTQ